MTSSKIEWTDRSDWNPIRGCTRVSQGCVNCYAELLAARFSKPGMWGEGIAEMKAGEPRWTGAVRLMDGRHLTRPLRWKKPAKIFVSSTSDVFHEKLDDEEISRIFAVMALCPQHTFQLLTKRAERMMIYFARPFPAHNVDAWQAEVCEEIDRLVPIRTDASRAAKDRVVAGPLPNVWIGVSVEDQENAEDRIPHLLNTPAAVRFLSCEPVLGPIDLTLDGLCCWPCSNCVDGSQDEPDTGANGCRRCDGTGMSEEIAIDWVICGGESGPYARPMRPSWARALRDQCAAGGVPFFFKQWGEHLTFPPESPCATKYESGWILSTDGRTFCGNEIQISEEGLTVKIGKGRAGRMLDGVEHNGFPGDG